MATAEELLKSVSAWQTGHFLLSSGLHSSEYMQCQRVLQYPAHGLELARQLAKKIVEAGLKPQVVVGPALGAVHLEVFVAIALNDLLEKELGSQVRAVFAERTEDGTGFAIRRGVELAPGERVLVVEDVTTTGGSAKKVVDLVKVMGADPIAVAAIIDRSGGRAKFDQPFINLVCLDIETFDTKDCPMCKSGSSATKPGSSNK
ncbi:MAG: orotate phosphoribosyltransferase [Cyanobacteria bacterium REEB67]|nr:orotate phosphoribosyltransferase [Cyanobacteria bacterium REEB67]